MPKSKLTGELKQRILELYPTKSLVEIGEILGIPRTSLKRYVNILIKEGNNLTKSKIKVEDGVIKRNCAICKEWLTLDNFHKKCDGAEGTSTTCKTCWSSYSNLYQQEILEEDQKRKYRRKYYIKTKEIQLNKGIVYRNKKYNEDPLFRITCLLRNSIRASLFRIGKKSLNKKLKLIGVTSKEIKEHFAKFDNTICTYCNKNIIRIQKKDEYEIDHIIPLGTDRSLEGIIKLNQLNNLRLICIECNGSLKLKEDLKLIKKGRI